MSWNGGDNTWNGSDDTGGDAWNNRGDTGGDAWNGGGETSGGDAPVGGSGGSDGDSGLKTCRICNQEGHFARECPDKPASGGLTGACFNCGEVGHNKADCTNPAKPMVCKLCKQEGHKAAECTSRRMPDWTGVPEIDAGDAWVALVDSANQKDIDAFRVALKAYARALDESFNLQDIESALREDKLPIYLIAKKQEIAVNMTVVDMIGNPGREYVLSVQLSEKPRRKKMAEGWPESPEQNLERLASAGFVQDIGVPLCSNCGELGHVRKHCKEEVSERENTAPAIQCIYCQEIGHRARDCPKERVNPFACKNCKQEGHIAKECPEPRSADNVECRKCNQMGHFSRDCPNVEERPPKACRNCGSTEHMVKECDQPRNPDTVTCNNCEKVGHFSRDCPEPKDWSKVKCRNCGEMGHSAKRCKAPAADEAKDGGVGFGDGSADVQPSGSWDTGNAGVESGAANGGW